MKSFSHKFTKCFVFPCFSHCILVHLLNNWRWLCEKKEEVFVGKNPIHKSLSHCLHRYHSLGESKRSLRPFSPKIHQILGEFFSSVKVWSPVFGLLGHPCKVDCKKQLMNTFFYASVLLQLSIMSSSCTNRIMFWFS